MTKMKLKNLHIATLYRWLDVPLHGSQMRSRNKFIKLIGEKNSEIEANRKKILAAYADKDEKGEPIIEHGIYKVPDEKKEEFIKTYNDTYLEEVNTIDVPGEVRSDLKVILMEKMTKGLGIEDGKVFEEIIESL